MLLVAVSLTHLIPILPSQEPLTRVVGSLGTAVCSGLIIKYLRLQYT